MVAKTITALIPTYNSAGTIRECLDSVKWVDKVFIVDSYSTDNTLDICREYTDWIVQHEYINSATQKNWAMDQIQTEWVLQIDSDETLDSSLALEIQAAIANADPVTDGYRIRLKNLVWGKWIQSCGYYPSWQIRVFKAHKGRWSKREVHAHVVGLENVQPLNNHIIHQDITNLASELRQFSNQVIDWEAKELQKQYKRWRWIDVTLRPAAIFLLIYFGRSGYRDGFRGLYLSVYRAFYSFMTYARLYEIEIESGLRT